MDEQPQLEDDTKKDANSVTPSSLSSQPTKTDSTVTSSPKSDQAIVYICSPNRTKQKQLRTILEKLKLRYSLHYYCDIDDNKKDDGSSTTCSEENDLMAIGSIRFPTTDQAEKAYALLNGMPLIAPSFSSSPTTTIQLRYNIFSRLYRDTLITPLVIHHLPKSMTLEAIYDLLREFGPIAQCRRLSSMNGDDYDGDQDQLAAPIEDDGVVVHYFLKEHAIQSQLKLDHAFIDGDQHPITVIAGIPNRGKSIMQDRQTDISNSDISNAAETSSSIKSRRKEKNRLSQHHEDQKRPLIQIEIKPTMDLCNLYVKGLSLSMTSNELFNLFKPYGRIISARVMANDKNVSKGFGFVSFSQPIEAASAMVHLHPHYNILFHEPKVPRSDHDIQQQYWSLAHSSLASYFFSTSVTLPIHLEPPTPVPPPPPPYYYYPSFPFPSYYYHPPIYYAPYPYPLPFVQRSEMQMAVQQALTNDKQQQQMVDSLMALDEEEKQHCLQDAAYLKEKLDQLLTDSLPPS